MFWIGFRIGNGKRNGNGRTFALVRPLPGSTAAPSGGAHRDGLGSAMALRLLPLLRLRGPPAQLVLRAGGTTVLPWGLLRPVRWCLPAVYGCYYWARHGRRRTQIPSRVLLLHGMWLLHRRGWILCAGRAIEALLWPVLWQAFMPASGCQGEDHDGRQTDALHPAGRDPQGRHPGPEGRRSRPGRRLSHSPHYRVRNALKFKQITSSSSLKFII